MRDYAELVTRLKQSDDNCNAECCECSGECLSSGCNIFSEAADAIEELLAKINELWTQLHVEGRSLIEELSQKAQQLRVETNIFDIEEIHPNCTVQILRNSVTGEVSVGWWENKEGADSDD